MPDEQCQHGQNAPIAVLVGLHDSQKGTGRHRCTNCAYQRGFEWGLVNATLPAVGLEQCQNGLFAPQNVLSHLPESQAGSGRHKCTICAYNHGFNDARAQALTPVVQPIVQPHVQPPVVIGTLKQSTPPVFNKTTPVEKTTFRGRQSVDYGTNADENKSVGNTGEALVEKWEKAELIRNGRPDLSQKVEIVATTKGDGLGYDVLSFTPSGEEKYIEVKTTTGDAETPFYLSATELSFSKQNPKNFYLFRVYNFNRADGSAQFYEVSGNIEESFNLNPVEFRVTRS